AEVTVQRLVKLVKSSILNLGASDAHFCSHSPTQAERAANTNPLSGEASQNQTPMQRHLLQTPSSPLPHGGARSTAHLRHGTALGMLEMPSQVSSLSARCLRRSAHGESQGALRAALQAGSELSRRGRFFGGAVASGVQDHGLSSSHSCAER